MDVVKQREKLVAVRGLIRDCRQGLEDVEQRRQVLANDLDHWLASEKQLVRELVIDSLTDGLMQDDDIKDVVEFAGQMIIDSAIVAEMARNNAGLVG